MCDGVHFPLAINQRQRRDPWLGCVKHAVKVSDQAMPCVPCRRCMRFWVAVNMKPEAVINLVVDVNVVGDASDSQT
jgi:hypothetical protein